MNKPKILIITILLFLLLPCLSALAKEYDASAEVLFTYGQTLMEKGRYLDAKHEFEKCLLVNPQHEEARLQLNLCQQLIAPQKNDAMLLALEETEKKINSQPEIIKTAAVEEKQPLSPPTEEEPVIPSIEEESLSPAIQKGAWTLAEGQLYTELYTKYYWHNHQFDAKGKKKRWDYDGKGNEIRTELKLEYGLNDEITLLLYTVAKEAHWKDSFKSCTQRGFVEMWPGLKYRLFEDPFICTLQGRVKFPFDYSELAVPALGTHQIDAELKILTAQPWPKLPGYTKFETGFRARNEEPSNEIPYFFEFGYNLAPWLTFKTTLDGNEGLAPQASGTDEDWIKYTVGPIFRISDIINMEFSFGHTFEGKNTSAAKEVICSISRQW